MAKATKEPTEAEQKAQAEKQHAAAEQWAKNHPEAGGAPLVDAAPTTKEHVGKLPGTEHKPDEFTPTLGGEPEAKPAKAAPAKSKKK